MTIPTELYPELQMIFDEVFNRDDIQLTPELTAAEVEGWDSFKQIELIIGVEMRFKIKFTPREVDQLGSIGDLAAMIAKKI